MQNFGCHIEIPKYKGLFQNTPLTAVAFFLQSPTVWKPPQWSEQEILRFDYSLKNITTKETNRLESSKIVVHGSYLINPASERQEVRDLSLTKFTDEVELCDKLKVGNYVFHPGVSKNTQQGLQLCVDLINRGLRSTKNVNILVENMTGTNKLCQNWKEVEWVISHLDSNYKNRVGCCMDTAHCWGAGLHMNSLLNDFDNTVGIEYLKAIHLNDSKADFKSNRDLHENLFEGKINKDFWEIFIFDERVEKIPTILETPTNCFPILKQFTSEFKCKVSYENEDWVKIERGNKILFRYIGKEPTNISFE